VGGIASRRRGIVAAASALLAALSLCAPALASPVATNEQQYQGLGRVFPDPLAGCQQGGESSPCSPFAQGNVPATQFIGYQEFVDGMKFLNSKPEWRRYLEVWPLDGKLGAGSGTKPGDEMFPGNNLGRLEWSPRKEFQSAGLPTTDVNRNKVDIFVARVTDETVPDAGKKRYALSLSIHGIERAGAEGGIRAIEDFVTAQTLGRSGNRILPRSAGPSPTFAEVLRHTIIYFSTPNPDGWRRGSVNEGGVFFQRYNGNGVDVNRDFPDIGFMHRFYSANSEPESRAIGSFFKGVEGATGDEFSAGDDLHGQPEADALSYTLLPHGRHDFVKDLRIRETAKKIHASTVSMVGWSPIVQPNDAPQGGGVPCTPGATLGSACAKIYGQTWGSVYDTINYTTTGALGDWFDSSIGLGADGIDNEMSFSHLDKNIVFDPHTEQMHVDGNKALIFAHLAMLQTPPNARFDAPGRKGYVPNERLKRAESKAPDPEEGTVADNPLDSGPTPGSSTFQFNVKQGPQPDGRNIYNGGMRVEVTAPNAQGVGTGQTTLSVECRGCDLHRERPEQHTGEADEWVTVAQDFNQSPIYLQSGVTVTVNQPQPTFTDKDGKRKPVEWRAVASNAGAPKFHVEFTNGPASDDGNTGGDPPPRLAPYDVANTDFFKDLDADMEPGLPGFSAITPADVIGGSRSLSGLDSLVLADNPLPGYKGLFGGTQVGDPPKDFDISWSPTVPGAYSPSLTDVKDRVPGSYTMIPFEIKTDQAAGGIKIRIDWEDAANNDFDMYLYRRTSSGLVLVGESTNTGGSTNYEEIDNRQQLPTGNYELYVDNWSAPDPRWTGSVKFRRVEVPSDTGSFSVDQKNAWVAKLKAWVEGGGNLVLTDGALRMLPELTNVPFSAVTPAQVYAGQVTFAKEGGASTTNDPLAQKPVTINQPGARFNSGGRRQTFEPTPLGFSIQPDTRSNADQSFSHQWDVDAKAFTAAGGRIAGTSADPGARDAQPVLERVTLGEIPLGKGQIRVLGALLPQPTEEFNHPYGLEPYAVTYTGYILTRNLLEVPQILSSPTIGGRFLISGRAVKLRRNAAAVRVSCRTPLACIGTLKLQATVRRRVKGKVRRSTVTLGKAKFNIATKQRNKVLQVKVRKSALRYVLAQRRIRVLATAPIRFTDGRRGIARKSFWLYRPSKARRR
jgi:hypothetical protein